MLSRATSAGIGLGLAVLAWAAPAAVAGDLFDPATGYRIDRYRAPVDRPAEGGAAVGLAELDRLIKERDAALIDVMPARAGYDPETGVWRLVDRRDNIPGSVWLPEVGRGAPEPRIAAYFERALARLTAGRPDRPLVFYCMTDCWMSWNAVRRAARLGHTAVYWYADGSDGWFDAGRELVRAEPWPVPPPAPAPESAAP
ncbi:rhodanese-like domain-containing protein [Methylopila musalis]|uniref:Rhodanese-like domain-containing protein n=1 Tax=Methylopila musalis TaxID=1134781 RepID=A0ABW3Z9D4_9HYPH